MFEHKTREDGTPFVTTFDIAPEWLKVAVHEAHRGDLPNDWIYAECEAAYTACTEGTLTSEDDSNYIDSQVNIYTTALFEWAAHLAGTNTFAEAEAEVDGLGDCPPSTSIEDRIRFVQYEAIAYIARTICTAYEANK